MAAYLVVSVEEIIDPDLLNEYGQRTNPITERHGGKVIGSSPNPTVLEGEITIVRSLVIEFPDLDALNGWYNDDEYKPLIELRQQAIKSTLWVVEGSQ